MWRILVYSICFMMIVTTPVRNVFAEGNPPDLFANRMELYKRTESVTNIPWHYLAAIDQYERNVRQASRDIPKAEGITGVYFTADKWAGILNPDQSDENPISIQFFDGMGSDGDGDGKASLSSDEDVLFSLLVSF